jgi:hypothetical protein
VSAGPRCRSSHSRPARSTSRSTSPSTRCLTDRLKRGWTSNERSWPTLQGAARLATELGAEAALCGGLRQVEGGTELAERLGVADADSAEVALSADDASSVALGFAELAAADSTRLRLSLAFRLILPPRSLMRTRLTLAGRAEESLAWAYLRHLARIGWSAPRGFLDWQRARR